MPKTQSKPGVAEQRIPHKRDFFFSPHYLPVYRLFLAFAVIIITAIIVLILASFSAASSLETMISQTSDTKQWQHKWTAALIKILLLSQKGLLIIVIFSPGLTITQFLIRPGQDLVGFIDAQRSDRLLPLLSWAMCGKQHTARERRATKGHLPLQILELFWETEWWFTLANWFISSADNQLFFSPCAHMLQWL